MSPVQQVLLIGHLLVSVVVIIVVVVVVVVVVCVKFCKMCFGVVLILFSGK